LFTYLWSARNEGAKNRFFLGSAGGVVLAVAFGARFAGDEMRLWRWIRSLWAHEHVYGRVWNTRQFRCRCGDVIDGDDLFSDPDHWMYRYWREHKPPVVK
jgi:hypothetical protein